MIENIIKDMVESNTTGRLADASKRFVDRMKDKNDIKKLLVDNGRFFAGYETNADKMMGDIANVLSEENLSQLAAELSRDSGYTFKARLQKGLADLMSAYEIPHEEAYLYATRMLSTVLYELPQVAPDKYDRYYQSEWREEQQQEAQEIISKLEKISNQMVVYAEKHMDICSTDDIDLQLKRQTVNPKIGIDFFDIDDDEFINVFNEVKNDEKVCVRARCREEAIYCIINELWKSGEKRPIFVVKKKKDWDRLAQVGETGNIYIPWFYADEIVSIENNTNIFIFTDGLPSFSDKEIELRPRTLETIRRALGRVGMDVNQANELVNETHGLYIPMKRRIFNGAYLKKPEWIAGLADNVKITCLLIGQWTDTDGDKAVIEELSGLKYDDFTEQVRKYADGEEPFVYIVKRSGASQYYLASVQNTWEYLDVSTDSEIWKKFMRSCIDVLNESEALFTYTFVERLAARYNGEYLFWSGNIRQGMLRTLLIKVCHKDHGSSQAILDNMVEEILGYVKTEQQWKYISTYFRELCELSPSKVLDRLENEWDKPTGLLKLFEKQSDNHMFDKNAYIDILWGVDTMLVQRPYAARAFGWLLRIDDMSYKYTSNTPADTIHKVICSWINLSAFRTTDEKVNVAKMTLEHDRNGWEHVYKSLPTYNSNLIGDIIKPRYRESVTPEMMSTEDIAVTMTRYVILLIRQADFKPERWEKLLDIAEEIPPEVKEMLIDNMLYETEQMSDEEKIHLKNCIRKEIYRHRFFRTADWAQPENVVKQYEKLLDEIHTEEPEYEYEYLFVQQHDGVLFNPVAYKEGNEREQNEKKTEIIIQEKIDEFRQKNLSLSKLADICAKEEHSSLGDCLARYWGNDYDENVLLTLYDAQPTHRQMALDYCSVLAYSGVDVYGHIMHLQEKRELDDEFMARIYRLQAACAGDGTPQITNAPERIKRLFWENADYYAPKQYDWALEECRKYGSVETYVKLLHTAMTKKHYTAQQIYDYFIQVKDMEVERSTAEIPYYLKELLAVLQKEYIDDDERCETIASVEIRFFDILQWTDVKCFKQILKASPENYAELVAMVFKKDGDNQERTLTEEQKKYINVVDRLYNKIRFCPTEKDGKVDAGELKEWVEHFKELLEKNNQASLLGYQLGRLLSSSPAGADGYYPCEAVREVIEEYSDETLIERYVACVHCDRGIYSPSEGKEEKNLARRYKENADYLSTLYPKTAAIYYELYDIYRDQAKHERERAESGLY